LLIAVSEVLSAPVSDTNAVLTAEIAACPVVSTDFRLETIPVTLPESFRCATELLKLLTAVQYVAAALLAAVVLALLAAVVLLLAAGELLLAVVLLLLLLPHPVSSAVAARARNSTVTGRRMRAFVRDE
jgi:hypothetical protein